MPKYYSILDNGVEKPMARDEGMSYGEAFGSAVSARKGRKKLKSGTGPQKPAKKKGNLKPGGSYTSGRAIPLGIPGPKKKANGSAPNISATRTGQNANHSLRGAPQVIRRADKKDAAKRRISGTTRGGRSKY